MLNSSAMSTIFEKLFKNYDMNVIPSENGDPLDIYTGIFINDMVPLESLNMVSSNFYSSHSNKNHYNREHSQRYNF